MPGLSFLKILTANLNTASEIDLASLYIGANSLHYCQRTTARLNTSARSDFMTQTGYSGRKGLRRRSHSSARVRLMYLPTCNGRRFTKRRLRIELRETAGHENQHFVP